MDGTNHTRTEDVCPSVNKHFTLFHRSLIEKKNLSLLQGVLFGEERGDTVIH